MTDSDCPWDLGHRNSDKFGYCEVSLTCRDCIHQGSFAENRRHSSLLSRKVFITECQVAYRLAKRAEDTESRWSFQEQPRMPPHRTGLLGWLLPLQQPCSQKGTLLEPQHHCFKQETTIIRKQLLLPDLEPPLICNRTCQQNGCSRPCAQTHCTHPSHIWILEPLQMPPAENPTRLLASRVDHILKSCPSWTYTLLELKLQ